MPGPNAGHGDHRTQTVREVWIIAPVKESYKLKETVIVANLPEFLTFLHTAG